MTSFIDQLATQGILRCPKCYAGDWRTFANELECLNCGAVWPVRNRVPDLFNRYHNSVAAFSSGPFSEHEALVSLIARALELSDDLPTRARIGEIVHRAATWSCDTPELTAEISDLRDRFAAEPAVTVLPVRASDANREPRIRWDRHYLPETLAPGTAISVNIRFTNIGAHPWSSRGEDPLVLAAHWRQDDADVSDQRSAQVPFPIDIPPGRSISLPVPLVAPLRTGSYSLRVQLVTAGRSAGEVLDLPVRVAPARRGLLSRLRPRHLRGQDAARSEVGPEIPDYGEDHAAGVAMVKSELERCMASGARILEVGSGTHPHLAWLTDYRVLALDISSPLLELGSLYFGDRFVDRLGFVCADALNPPLAPASFNAVAMFSALHHFAEPEVVLRRLAKLLKPSGLLAVMCEPVGDTLEQPATIRDLLKGINEQVFSLDEYQRIFRWAGLRARRVRMDRGSLKAILTV